MKFNPVAILYFIDGVAPTHDDILKAAALNAKVMFRNARAVPAEGSLEICDGVAGKVPPQYSKFPTAEAAIDKRASEIAALAAKVGDSPAPASPQAPAPSTAAQTDGQADAAQQTGSDAASVGGAGDAAAADAAAPGASGPAGVWAKN